MNEFFSIFQRKMLKLKKDTEHPNFIDLIQKILVEFK